MKLIEISPFIRYCFPNKILPFKKDVTSIDCRLFYITEGSGSIFINDVEYKFNKDTLMLWQGGTKYRFCSNDVISLISVNFDYTLENSNHVEYYKVIPYGELENKPKSIYFEDYKILNEPIVIENALYLSEVRKYLDKTLYEKENQSPLQNAKMSTYFKTCIISVVEYLSISSNSISNINKFEKIVDYIKNNYTDDISNDDIANIIGYHPYYLNKLFSEHFGTTLHQYLINYRLIVCENLLISTNKSVTDIAIETGFKSNVSLTINFKRKHNLTPSEFRKRYTNFA